MSERLENLIPISITKESDVLVSARDLHNFLEIKTNFRLWYPKMIDYGFLENEDYQSVYEKTNTFSGGQTVVDYMMTTDMAKEISTIQRSEKGRQARLYFLGVEKKLKSAQIALRSLLQMTESNFRNSTTFTRSDSGKKYDRSGYDKDKSVDVSGGEWLVYDKENTDGSYGEELVYDKERVNASYGEELVYNKETVNDSYGEGPVYDKGRVNTSYGEELSYKKENVDSSYDNETIYKKENISTTYEIADRKSTLKTNFRDTSKLFGIRENLFVNWLLLNNYCYRDKNGTIKPYARVMDYFYMKEFVTENGHSGMQTLINPRGREFFRNVLIDEKIIKEEVKIFK